jgi:hypothetical protein
METPDLLVEDIRQFFRRFRLRRLGSQSGQILA